jgi:hypothetical protein
VTVEQYLSQGDRWYPSGTIALQFVTAVTSGTATLAVSSEVTSRAGPKPAAPTILNKDSSLKKKLHTNMSNKAR